MRRSYKDIPINTSENTHETVFKLINASKDSAVADIPSGQGAFVLRLKDSGYQNVWALDIQNIMRFPHEQFAIGDMTKSFGLKDESLQSLISIDGIEHIHEQNIFVQEVYRVLKPGGEFIISTPNISSIRSRLKWFLTGHHHKCDSPLDENNPNPLHHISMISYPELRYLLHTHGFRIQLVTTNQIKFASWLMLPLWPIIALTTILSYRKTGRRDKTLKLNMEILKTVLSKSVFFGETLIVKAIKKS